MKTQPENIVLLRNKQKDELAEQAMSMQQLKKELITNQKKTKRLEESIVKKREELTALSNNINRVLEKQMNVKYRQASFLDILKTIEVKPNLKLKHDQLMKVEKEIQQIKSEIEQSRNQRDTTLNQKVDGIANVISTKDAQIKSLTNERNTLKKGIRTVEQQTKSISEPMLQNMKIMQKEAQTLRKDIKQYEKDNYYYDNELMLLCSYVCEIEQKINMIALLKSMQPHMVNKKDFKAQAKQLIKNLMERQQLDSKATQQIAAKQKDLRDCEARNMEFRKKLREIQNQITRSEIDSFNKKSVTERVHSSQNLKQVHSSQALKEPQKQYHSHKTSLNPVTTNPLYNRPEKLVYKLGSTTLTPTGIIISDSNITSNPRARIKQLVIYTTQSCEIVGLEAKYMLKGEIIQGKNMISYSVKKCEKHLIEFEKIDSLCIVYGDKNIYCIKTTGSNGSCLIGVDHPGITQLVLLRQFNLLGIDVSFDLGNNANETNIVGMILTVEKKTSIKKQMTNPIGFIEEDIQILDEVEEKSIKRWKSVSHKNIIHKGELPKLNAKQIIDHRLMGAQNGRSG